MCKQFFGLMILFCLIPSWIYAFDHKQTHPELTTQAVKNTEYFENVLKMQLGFEDADKLLNNGEHTYSITKWLKEGSKEEDDPACRAASHFHNPLKPWTESRLTDPLWIVDRWCEISSPFREKYSNVSWATGFGDKDGNTMPDTVNGISALPEQNGRNWFVARALYYSALTEENPQQREVLFAETFRTIGYVLHLLEDMAVPAHTRNDFSEGHSQFIGCSKEDGCWPVSWIGNPFEGYVRDYYEKEIKPLIIADISKPFTGEKKLTNFWDTDTYKAGTNPINFSGQDLGLAEYSNINFVSHATIFKKESDTEHYFQYPSRASIIDETFPDKINTKIYDNMLAKDGKLDTGIYVTKEAGEGHEIKKFVSLRYALYGQDGDPDMYYLKFKLDDQCYLEYATHLIPRAIGYSAALLDYFFRGRMDVEFTDGQVTLFNRSEETMENGKFELFYETEDGVRKALNGLSNAEVTTPLLPGDSQIVSFIMPADFYNCSFKTKFISVYRGKLGAELNAVAGKVVDVGTDCVVIKAGESAGTQFFTVWDPSTNSVANIFDPVTGELINFPASFEEIGNWLSERSTTAAIPAYNWEMENNVLKRIGESWQDLDSCTCTVDTDIETTCNDNKIGEVFTHPGCGSFQSSCDYSQSLTTENDSDVWNTVSEGWVYVDKTFWETILGSYAPLVNTSVGNGEPACMRSTWYQRQTVRTYIPEGSFLPFNEWEISQPITWITPIGEMDLPSESYLGTDDFYSVYTCPSSSTWSRWHRNPPEDGEPVAKPIIYTNYSETVMVQLYLVSVVQWSGSQSEDPISDNSRECEVTSYEESYVTENRVVGACTMNPGGATPPDPRSQERNFQFEDTVLALVDYTVNKQRDAGEISDEEVFQGGISIYIAESEDSGTESLMKLVNDARLEVELYPLLPDNNLNGAAQSHATDMAENQFMSHVGSDGVTFQARINETGYSNIVKPGGSSGATEYIANGYETVDEIFGALRISSSWDEVINNGYREMGVGNKIGVDGKRYWCLVFGFNDEH